MMSTWAQRAYNVICYTLRQSSHLLPTDRVKAVDAAYPFGQRAYHPYKQWLKVRREILTGQGLIQPGKRVSKTNWKPEDAPLFDPTVGPPAPVDA